MKRVHRALLIVKCYDEISRLLCSPALQMPQKAGGGDVVYTVVESRVLREVPSPLRDGLMVRVFF